MTDHDAYDGLVYFFGHIESEINKGKEIGGSVISVMASPHPEAVRLDPAKALLCVLADEQRTDADRGQWMNA